MITFIDGPAAGAELACARAPIYLRAVIDETTAEINALDQLDDTPGPSERVHVYRRTRYGGVIFACARGRGAKSSQIASAEYVHMPDVNGEHLRDNEAWRAWCRGQPEARPRAEEFERSTP